MSYTIDDGKREVATLYIEPVILVSRLLLSIGKGQFNTQIAWNTAAKSTPEVKKKMKFHLTLAGTFRSRPQYTRESR